MGVMTAKFTDATSGPAMTVHKSSVGVKMSSEHADALLAAPDAKDIMAKSLFATMTDKAILLEYILVTSMKKQSARRLGEADGRRLAGDATIKVDFSIIIPASKAVKFTAATVDVTKMAEAIKTTAAASGVTVTVIGTPSVEAVVTETVGGETVTGAASPMAGSALAAFMMAIVTMLSA